MEFSLRWLALLASTLFNVCLTENVKIWKFDTNFDNAENWDKKALPCKTSEVVFPADAQVPVELPMRYRSSSLLEVRRMVLSRQGSLVFPPIAGGFTLGHEGLHASCPGGEVKFIRTGRKRWADPSNWLRSNEATPHLERIPCRYDNVVFRNDSSFHVTLPNRPVTVSTITIQGRTFSTGKPWEEFLVSDVGMKTFGNNFNIEVTGESCSAAEGCDCDNAHLFGDVCTGKWKWQTPPCANPVTPIGFCFPICGAYLLYKFGSVPDIRAAVEIFVRTTGVTSYTSRTSGFVQVVLVDSNEYSGLSSRISNELHSYLVKEGLVKSTLAAMQSSGLRITNVDASGVMQRLSFAFLCSLVLFGIIFCTYERNWTGALNWDNIRSLWSGASNGAFAFARFENASGTVEISEEAVAQSQRYRAKPDDGHGFKNPMFSESERPSESKGNVALSRLDRRRSSSCSVESDSSVGTDSTSNDRNSLKEVPLQGHENIHTISAYESSD
ncbi:single organism signaling [Nesidiocoris tenuis]|uniref:Protein amnionless n=1 Tax=Nesidiocoris tenuis TaxID=355587 RepID=A0ABN7A7F5_9HEMI|nr:single organism signaling [Nesidiocoris tenuis]